MKKVLLLGCTLLLVFCVSKKTTVQTEGLEEVLVFGEEESNISTEPVLPEPMAIVTPPPESEEVIMPPVSEEVVMPPLSEEVVLPPISEEVVLPPISEEIVLPAITEPPVTEEVIAPPVIEETVPPITEVALAPPVIEEPTMPAYMPTPSPVSTPAPPPPASVLGFRVQIFASSTEQNANRIAGDARDTFGDAYVEFVAPYYKVRVGNCLTREEAESLKSKALNMGYRGAFVVETRIAP